MKVSFFKLPLVFMAVFFAFSISNQLILFLTSNKDNYPILEFIIKLISSNLIFIGQRALLLFFVVAIAFYQARIHRLTSKNILLAAIIALGVVILQFLVSRIAGITVYRYIFSLYDVYSSYWIISVVQSFLGITYLLIMVVAAYYVIWGLRNVFDHNMDDYALTSDNLKSIHCILFVILFIFILLFCYVYTRNLWGDLYNEFRIYYSIFVYLVIAVIAAFITLLIKNLFNYPYETLQVGRIVKVVILTFLLSVIIDAIISFLTLFLVIVMAFSHRYNSEFGVIILVLTSFVIQIVIFGLIGRFFVKRNFSIRNNEALDNQ